MIWLTVQQPHAQLRAHGGGVAAHKGFALVRVEFARQAPAQDGFFERVMKRLGIGRRIVAAEDDEPGAIVDKHAQVGGLGLA